MQHGLYRYTRDDVEQIERDWFGGDQLDIISTTYSAGRLDASRITWTQGGRGQERLDSLRRAFGDTDRRLLTIYHFGGDESGDYSTAANGGHDAAYREFARTLVGLGMEDTLIVPSHEFNLPWGRYPNDPANYASGMARLMREMLSVDGAEFEFVYAPGGNRLGVTEACWPATAPEWDASLPTPYVAPSFYDTSPDYPDTLPSGSELDRVRREVWNGWHLDMLGMWKDFADSVGAQMAFREWGCSTPDYRNASGGDNPYFVRKMFEWMRANGVAFQTYWNAWTAGGGTGGHLIWPEGESRLPKVAAEWVQQVKQDRESDGTTPPPEPEPEPDPDPPDETPESAPFKTYRAPTRIDATHFDYGGWGDSGRRRGDSGFRPETNVDIEAPSNGGSGDGSIGWVDAGDWTAYTVRVPAGEWRVSMGASSENGGRLRVTAGETTIGDVSLNNGSWYDFVARDVGRIVVDDDRDVTLRVESVEHAVNYDWLELTPVDSDGGDDGRDETGDGDGEMHTLRIEFTDAVEYGVPVRGQFLDVPDSATEGEPRETGETWIHGYGRDGWTARVRFVGTLGKPDLDIGAAELTLDGESYQP